MIPQSIWWIRRLSFTLVVLGGYDSWATFNNEHTVEVTDFMLYHPRWKPSNSRFRFLAIGTGAADKDRPGAAGSRIERAARNPYRWKGGQCWLPPDLPGPLSSTEVNRWSGQPMEPPSDFWSCRAGLQYHCSPRVHLTHGL
jgi:hypothetical protein